MPLHPQAATFLQQLNQLNLPPMETVPIEVTRRSLIAASTVKMAPADLARIETRMISRSRSLDPLLPQAASGPAAADDALQVRIYWPQGTGPFAACMYFHGGGWVLNNIDTHDDVARRLAEASGCVVVSVDYRLAPEHRYPAAIEDAYTALTWIVDNAKELQVDSGRIAVSGDSAGGNIAAVLCLMARDRGGPKIAFQALIYPITDCDFERPSYRENADGYFLTASQMHWFWQHYVSSPEQMSEPYASPLRAESLRGLPPALILTAEYDPLRDEGEAYGAALQQAGVATEVVRYDGLIHAFIKRVDQFDAAIIAIRQIGSALKRNLGSQPVAKGG